MTFSSWSGIIPQLVLPDYPPLELDMFPALTTADLDARMKKDSSLPIALTVGLPLLLLAGFLLLMCTRPGTAAMATAYAFIM